MEPNNPIVFIPDAGELTDAFAEVVNMLPAGVKPRIAPWEETAEAGQAHVENLLDKHELRRIILVGGGRGAAVALRIAQAQPGRITHLVLDSPAISLDEQGRRVGRALKKIPGFLLRGRKKELVSHVDELSNSTAADYADVGIPTLVISGSRYPLPGAKDLVGTLPRAVGVTIEGAGLRTYTTHPADFSAEVARFLHTGSAEQV